MITHVEPPHKTAWIYIEYNATLGLEEQWILKLNDLSMARIVHPWNSSQLLAVIQGPYGNIINIVTHHADVEPTIASIEQLKAEVIMGAKDLGWNIPV